MHCLIKVYRDSGLPDHRTPLGLGKKVILTSREILTETHQVLLHDGLLEEGQSGLVPEDVLNRDLALAMLAELWPIPARKFRTDT